MFWRFSAQNSVACERTLPRLTVGIAVDSRLIGDCSCPRYFYFDQHPCIDYYAPKTVRNFGRWRPPKPFCLWKYVDVFLFVRASRQDQCADPRPPRTGAMPHTIPWPAGLDYLSLVTSSACWKIGLRSWACQWEYQAHLTIFSRNKEHICFGRFLIPKVPRFLPLMCIPVGFLAVPTHISLGEQSITGNSHPSSPLKYGLKPCNRIHVSWVDIGKGLEVD